MRKIPDRPFGLFISGWFGSGQTTQRNLLCAGRPRLYKTAPSATTRDPRHDDAPGDYEHYMEEGFDLMVNRGDFLEWKLVHGKKYGTERKYLTELEPDRVLCKQVDPQGLQQILEENPSTIGVILTIPEEEAVRRFTLRTEKAVGTVDPDDLERRIMSLRRDQALLPEISAQFGPDRLLVLSTWDESQFRVAHTIDAWALDIFRP